MRIVFAGTPEFAAPPLAALLKSRHQVCLVVTQPDRPAGRGRRAHVPPVKELALAYDVPVIQPLSISRPESLAAIEAVEPDAVVVTAYGKQLSKRALDLPKLGCFNLHPSLLPRYRGAAPVHHAILNGERETGITVVRMTPEMDAGTIVAQQATDIYENETTGELKRHLAALAADIIVPTLNTVEAGWAVEKPQDPTQVTLAPRLKKSDGWIQWTKAVHEIRNFIRAMTPWPGAFTCHVPISGRRKRRLLLLASQPGPERRSGRRKKLPGGGAPGKVVIADKRLAVGTGDGLLTILRVIPEGGRPMDANAYLRGHALQVGDIFRGPE